MFGLDRSSQVIALASILVDPFYRTFNGFSVLIEKEFAGHGHPMSIRLGFKRDKSEERSPILIEFLECVHQLVVAFPPYFEYSAAYLARIGYELYTRRYHNF